MKPVPVHLFYETAGSREYCLRIGCDTDRRILIIPPLFDEMNSTRRMLVEAMRNLAQRGVCTHLLDLPGCNESGVPLSVQSITSWRLAVADAAGQLKATHLASIRGGCLLDDVADLPLWRLAPVKGAALLKTLLRARIAADKEGGIHITADQLLKDGRAQGIHLAGHRLGPQMLSELDAAIPVPLERVTEDALSDVAGTPLWLRGEPADKSEMSAALAARLDAWSAACGR